MNENPLAFFITWTVYGTHLQGDARGWRKWGHGAMIPQPLLAQWRAGRLKYPIMLLNADQRAAINGEIARLCDYRRWKLWSANARTNHVHCVVTAINVDGRKVRDQLKANCTRVLRERWPTFIDRPAWTEGGDWQCINADDDLEQVINYVAEEQDRKERDDHSSAGGR